MSGDNSFKPVTDEYGNFVIDINEMESRESDRNRLAMIDNFSYLTVFIVLALIALGIASFSKDGLQNIGQSLVFLLER
jgi:hypothetical protein